jgi:hypothetical protein
MNMMYRWMTLAVAFVAWATVGQALAHGGHGEVVADAPVIATRAALEGVVRKVVIDDESNDAVHEYQLLATPDGVYRLLQGSVAGSLESGARYVIQGTTNGKYVTAESAAHAVTTSAKATAVAGPFAIDGTLRMGHIDFTDRPSEYFFAVFGADGHHKRLPGAELLDALQNGMEVSAFGNIGTDGALAVEHIVIHRHAAVPAVNEIHAKAASTHTIFVAPVKFPTNSAAPFTYPAEPFTVATLNTAVFGALPTKSVVEYYKEVSYGQQTLTGVTAKQGTPAQWLAATQHPPVDTKGNPTCDIDFIQDQGTAAALAAGYTSANLNPGNMTPGSTASANHVVFVFSATGFNCGWSGLAYIGYGLAFIKQTTSLAVIGHELGHTFGLYHAGSLDCGANPIGGTCSVSEYGDPYDVMGNSSAMHFSAFQKQTLKWITDTSVTTHAGGSTSYTLTPIETPGGSRYAVRIPAAANRTYWLEYRQPIGFDSGISVANANGAQVRVIRPFETNCGNCDAFSNDTELLDMTPTTATFADAALATGSRFVDAYYGIAVDVVSQTPSALTVQVTSLVKPDYPSFDANTRTDLLWRNGSNGQISMWLMNGTSIASSKTISTDPNWTVTLVGDFDGDGKTDLLLRNSTTGATAMWLMDGTTVRSSATIMPDANWHAMFARDLNRDGRDDIIWRNTANGKTVLWTMNGLGITGSLPLMNDVNWNLQYIADFAGDNNSDLVWRNSATGQTVIWMMNGLAVTRGVPVMNDPAWSIAATGDFDGDGKTDLVWRNTSGNTTLWLMNGIAIAGNVPLQSDPNVQVANIVDLNGDGNSDLIFRNSTSGQTFAWLMDGTAAIGGANLLGTPWRIERVGDFDGDGKTDIVWANTSTGEKVLWLMNGASPAANYSFGNPGNLSTIP